MKKLTLVVLLSAVCGFAQQSVEKVKFAAKITNRLSDTLTITGANNFKQVMLADKKGGFTSTFEAKEGFYRLINGTESTNLFLSPGNNITTTLDGKQFDETLTYKGKGAEENNFLAQSALRNEKFFNELFSKDQAAFDAALAEKEKTETEILNKGNYNTYFKDMLTKSLASSLKRSKAQYEAVQKNAGLKGKASPSFDYENHKGGKTKLEDLRGKYVYIDVWATWCGPCRMEIPYLQKIEEKYHGKNIAFVSISVDVAKDYEKWKKMVSDKNLGGIQLIADKDWKSDFVTAYGITGIPRFILIDPNGNIVSADADRPSSGKLEPLFDSILK